jgi:hypothetical protein
MGWCIDQISIVRIDSTITDALKNPDTLVKILQCSNWIRLDHYYSWVSHAIAALPQCIASSIEVNANA